MNDKNRAIFVAGIIALIVAGILLGIYAADRRARESAIERSEQVLESSALEQASTLAYTLEGKLQLLRGVAAAVAISGAEDANAALADIVSAAQLSFANVELIYPDGGKARDSSDIDVSDRAYFQKAMAGEGVIEQFIGRRTGKTCVAMTVPVYLNGEVTCVLRGLYYEENLRHLMNSEAYGGAGYSFLVDGDGDIVVNAETDSRYLDAGNVFEMLDAAEFSGESTAETVRAALEAREGVSLRYEYEGETRIAALVPVGEELLSGNDWFVLNVVPEDSLLNEIDVSRRDSIESMMIFVVFASAAIILFMILEHDYRRKKRAESELTRQREEQFRIVTEQSGKFVMRYDIPTRTASRGDVAADGFGGSEHSSNAVEDSIEHGYIDASSAEDYRDFFRRIDAGESPVTSDFLMIRPDGEKRWYRHSSTTIFDSAGRPKTAIISYFDDTEQRGRELAYSKWQQELNSISEEDTALYEWNLTKDKNEGSRGTLVTTFSGEAETDFDARAEYFAANSVAEEDRAAFVALLNREHLIAGYFLKKYRLGLDYRVVAEDGEMRWRSATVQLVPYPDTQDIKAYITVRDIDGEKRRELAVLDSSRNDFLTGAMNRGAFVGGVKELLARAPDTGHALLMLDADGFKQVNDTLGHDAGDRVLSELVGGVRSVLRASDMVGRIGGDEFMVCLPDMSLDADIAKKAVQICDALRREVGNRLRLSVSIGVAVYPRDGGSFEELYRKSDAALYHAKKAGRDGYAFYRDGMSGSAGESAIDAGE